MAPKLPSSFGTMPSTLVTRTSSPSRTPCTAASLLGQTRAATYIHRPRRPYTFTQLIQLSDGSTFTARTTSPLPMHRADKDSRNTLLWQPTEKTLQNVETDEAGKLAAFRQRFGHGFDFSTAEEDAAAAEGPIVQRKGGRALREADIKKLEEERRAKAEAAKKQEEDILDLGDLISGYATPVEEKTGQKKGGKPKK